MTQSTDGPWPQALDFVSMLQNPSVGFHDPELKTCEIERDSNRQPRPRSGAFAACYKGILPSKKNVCIRLFTRKADEMHERYSKISEHLKANPIDCLVKFEYVEKGIRHPNPAKVGNRSWFPIVRMDWVDGCILFDWLRDRCQANDSAAIGRVSERWVALAEQLSSVGIAHGDLQQANVMVTPKGDLKLVDYDCMCVPALVGRPNLELGVEPYQHPERNDDTKLFPGLDHFSELFILLALRALAADPQLWFRHIEPPGGEPYDKLLIRKADLDDPQQSAIFAEFKQSSDREVGRLAAELLRQLKLPMARIPPLATFVFDYDEVRTMFRQRQWDEGLERLKKCPPGNQPADLIAASATARDCVTARIELERCIQSGNEQQIQAAYKPKLLDDYPAASASVQTAKTSATVQAILKQLDEARQARQWRKLVSLWDTNRTLLSSRISARGYKSDVESWRERNELCDRVRQLQAAKPLDGTALREACQLLTSKGGHPEIDAEIPNIHRMEKRSSALQLLMNVPDIPGEANDQSLIAAWKEDLFAGWSDAERERPRVAEADARLKLVERVREAVEAANPSRSIKTEKNIYLLARELPRQYEFKSGLRSRIANARACLMALEPIEKALAEKAPSERILAQGWQSLDELKALSLLPGNVRDRLELAARRVPLLDKLEAINLRQPMDIVDQAIKAVWKEDLLHNCADAAPWKKLASDAMARTAILAELDLAAESTDDAKVAAIVDNPLLQGYPFGSTLAGRIQSATAKLTRIQSLVNALVAHDDAGFAKQFDHRIIKANRSMFIPYQSQIHDILIREILPVEKLSLAKPLVGRPVDAAKNVVNRYQVKWNWPSQRFTDNCLLGICRGTPSGRVDPAEVAVHRIPIDRQRWEAGGGVYSLTVKPDWRAKLADMVVVWAVIDLGFGTFFSEPLALGRVSYQEAMSM